MKLKYIHYELLEKCKHGSNKAQFEIYKLYYKGMYNVSLRMVQNSQEAEDVIQEAFLSAFEKLETWSEEVSFGSWLKKIVINKSLDYLKKRKMQLTELDGKEPVNDENNSEDLEIISLKVEEIKRAVNNLPEKYRIITLMFLFEGYSHDEISEIAGITPETSRVRFKRAKDMIVKSPEIKEAFEKISMN
ncbi:MAG: sigma-70 family RNA polymerase sigma factor [Bacteroidales bacterium]|nr:sigma-70 family RNA polymerase sigma factor [Bacteroidales bacterium]